MNTNLVGLTAIINLIGDVARDTIIGLGKGENAIQRIGDYENLLPDITALIHTVGDVPAEASALQPQDYLTLMETLAARLVISNTHAGNIIEASLLLLNHITNIVVPDIKQLLDAVKGAPVN